MANKKPVTLSIDTTIHEDLGHVKRTMGLQMGTVLSELYRAWRNGSVNISTLPRGDFDGPLTRR